MLYRSEAAAAELDALLAAAGRHHGADFPDLFGAALAGAAGVDHGLAVSSDSAAVSTLIGALGLRAGERVLVAAHLRPRFVFALLFAGLVPVVVDCLREDLTLDAAAIDAAVTGTMRAAFLAAPWGVAQDMPPIRDALAAKGCRVILDLTEGLCPGLAQGGMAASVDVALLSLTEGNSLLSTGEGGALLSNDEGLMRMALSYQRFADLKGLLPGINQKMSAMQASLGLLRLERLGDDDGRTWDGVGEVVVRTGTYAVLRNAETEHRLRQVCRLPQAHRLACVGEHAAPCPRLDGLAASLAAVPLARNEAGHV